MWEGRREGVPRVKKHQTKETEEVTEKRRNLQRGSKNIGKEGSCCEMGNKEPRY